MSDEVIAENRMLKERIKFLEVSLKAAENNANELVILSREIALAAVHHVRKVELESAELYALIEEIEDVHIRAYDKRIDELDTEIKVFRNKEKQYIDSSQNSQRNINELLGKVEKYEKMLFEPDAVSTDFRPTDATFTSETSSRRTSNLPISGKINNPVFGVTATSSILVSSVKDGYMLKKSPAMFKGWQRRYFVLTSDSKLAWHEKEQDYRRHKAERGSFFLSDIPSANISSCISSNNEFIKIIVNGKTYELDCAREESAQSWYTAITNVCIK